MTSHPRVPIGSRDREITELRQAPRTADEVARVRQYRLEQAANRGQLDCVFGHALPVKRRQRGAWAWLRRVFGC